MRVGVGGEKLNKIECGNVFKSIPVRYFVCCIFFFAVDMYYIALLFVWCGRFGNRETRAGALNSIETHFTTQ